MQDCSAQGVHQDSMKVSLYIDDCLKTDMPAQFLC